MVRYEDRGIQVVDSPHCGAAHWQSIQPDRVTCQRDLEAQYWQYKAH
jgi:competence protein ComEC